MGREVAAQRRKRTAAARRKIRHLIVSMIVAFVFCALWTVLSYVFQKVAA